MLARLTVRDGEDVCRDGQAILNARVRIGAPLSGNEKAAFRNTLVKVERLLVALDDLKDKMELFEYFDLETQSQTLCLIVSGGLISLTAQ